MALLAAGSLAVAFGSGALSTPAPTGGPRAVGPAPAGERIGFALLLRMPGATRMRLELAAIENPRSPRFRRLIGPRAFGARFGVSAGALRALGRALQAHGVRVTAVYPQRTQLDVTATVGTVERLLDVRILAYAERDGRRYRAAAGRPVIPAALRRWVAAVTGLDTRPLMRPRDVPMGGLTPSLTASAYDLAPLHAAGFLGQGQTIAVISFSAFDPSDPTSFAERYGLSGPNPQVVAVDGGTTDTSGQDEANLDIDVIRAIAPRAQILFYEVPQSSASYSDVINRIVADGRASIISSSWGQCELVVSPQERAAEQSALDAAVARGISSFIAAGDSGAYDCQGFDLADHRLTVDWPAASPDVVAVGGTRLYLAPDGSYERETAWEDQLSDAGGGGGFSATQARPSWQTGPGVQDRYSDGRRQVPDVSADADPATGWSFVSGGQLGEAGGTSAAAPFWAASTALIEQYAAAQGIHRLGFVDPLLYALAAARQAYPPFHQVTIGANRYYPAADGWNPATGLGSPDVYNLARDLVAYLRGHGR